MREQPRWDEHARFMNALESRRVLVVGGPLGGAAVHRALLILDLPDEAAVRRQLAEDPWHRDGVLRVREVYSWQVLLGGAAFPTGAPSDRPESR